MRNHDAGNFGILKEFVATFGELQEAFVRHVVGAYLEDLFSGNIGKFLHLRNGLNQNLDA